MALTGLIHQGDGLAQDGAHLLGEGPHRGAFHLHLDTEGADLLLDGKNPEFRCKGH